LTAAEFRDDVVGLLRALDRQSRFDYLPSYLSHGADVTRMARTVRVIGRVRRFSEGTGRTDVAEEFGRSDRAARTDPDKWR
jgi:hypothetical protein